MKLGLNHFRLQVTAVNAVNVEVKEEFMEEATKVKVVIVKLLKEDWVNLVKEDWVNLVKEDWVNLIKEDSVNLVK